VPLLHGGGTRGHPEKGWGVMPKFTRRGGYSNAAEPAEPVELAQSDEPSGPVQIEVESELDDDASEPSLGFKIGTELMFDDDDDGPTEGSPETAW
jgi:hypothetical protein